MRRGRSHRLGGLAAAMAISSRSAQRFGALDHRGLTNLWRFAVFAATAHAKVIFRDSFSVVNASCGDTSCSDCIPSCKSCPWDLSLTGTPCNHSTRTIAPCPAGRSGSCVLFNVTYCGGSGASSGACYRSEFSGTAGQSEGFQYGTDYWFGFSLRLPDAYTLGKVNPQEEIHFQMHGNSLPAAHHQATHAFPHKAPRELPPLPNPWPSRTSSGSPNRQLREPWRNPIFALSVLPNKDYDHSGKQLPYSGKASWEVTARGDPRLNITQRIKPDGHGTWDYKWENATTIGDAVGGQWENFVYHTRQVHFDLRT